MKLCLLALLAACSESRIRPNPAADQRAEEVAQMAAAMATPDQADNGAEGAAAAAASRLALQATVSRAVAVYYVRLDELQRYQAGADSEALLHATGERFYAVLQGAQVTSSLSLVKRDGEWTTESMGDPTLSAPLFAHMQALPEASVASLGLVEVPSLGASFLVHQENGEQYLTLLADAPAVGLPVGAKVTLRDALATLSLAAQKISIDFD